MTLRRMPTPIHKEEWVRYYSQRILGTWTCRATPLTVAKDYADHIAGELVLLYNDPLKRAFIEATYSSCD